MGKHRKNTSNKKKAKPQHKAKRSTSTKQMRKRRHVFVSLINCNEFDSTGEGEKGRTRRRADETARRQEGSRVAAAFLPPSPTPNVPKGTRKNQTKQDCQRVFANASLDKCENTPKKSSREKKSLKVFCQ